MSTRVKFLWAVLTAALALSLEAGVASALRSLSVGGETTIRGSGVVSFVSASAGATIRCPTTITRTVSRFIPKVREILLGRITRIDVQPPEANCSSSIGTLQNIRIIGLEEARCRLFLRTFIGTLPNILGIIKVIRNCLIGFTTRVFLVGNIECIYEEEAGRGGIEVRENLNAARRFISAEIRTNKAVKLSGSELCPEEGELSGNLTVSNGPTITLV